MNQEKLRSDIVAAQDELERLERYREAKHLLYIEARLKWFNATRAVAEKYKQVDDLKSRLTPNTYFWLGDGE